MTGELPARFWRPQLCHIVHPLPCTPAHQPVVVPQVLPLPRCLAPPPLSTSTGHLADPTFARPFAPTLASRSLVWCACTPRSLFTTRPCPRYRRLPPRQEWGVLLSIALAAAALSCSLSIADGAGPLREPPSAVLAPSGWCVGTYPRPCPRPRSRHKPARGSGHNFRCPASAMGASRLSRRVGFCWIAAEDSHELLECPWHRAYGMVEALMLGSLHS
ncbi:hypothetical protein B0H14DRAFT_3497144 [Mycena olivaceomarginata]|nr:hypothetical protein B0H14DRAFT_3497144 [Mycena olivaceomarginata]